MKQRLFLLLCVILGTFCSASAQQTLWFHNPDRFGEHQAIDMSDVDSVCFTKMKMTFYKNDGTTFSRVYSSKYDYYTFHDPGLGIYKPRELNTMDFDIPSSKWCWARSRESEHFIIFWDSGFGTDPIRGNGSARFNPNTLLENAEYFFKMYTDSLGFAFVGNSKTVDTYKLEIYVNSDATWLATGSGYDDKIGALWCNYSAVNSPSTLAHEIGHSFQYIVSCDLGTTHGWRYGFGDNASGGCAWWESCAQWQAFRCYPREKFSGYYSPGYFHLNLLHEEWRYYNHYIQDYWAMLHGAKFIGRMWRESTKPEDPVETYKRLTGIDQSAFNDEMYDFAARSVTWDIDDIRELGANKMTQTTEMTRVDETNKIWQVDEKQCPQNYGYNAIPLTVRPKGTVVKAHFKGIAGADGYRKVNVAKAGWRYGFVALGNDGTRFYGEMKREPEGTAEIMLPDDVQKLWFVVSGAPVEHWRHPWDDNTSNDEQWPYQVQFEETDRNGYFVLTGDPEDIDLQLNASIQYAESGTLYARVPLNYDVVSQAFKVSADQVRDTKNNPQDEFCTFVKDKDGTIIEGTTNNLYCFYRDGSVADYSDTDDNIVIYASYMSYYKGFYLIANNKAVHPGDSFVIPMGIRYRPANDPEGKTYYANCTITVTITE